MRSVGIVNRLKVKGKRAKVDGSHNHEGQRCFALLSMTRLLELYFILTYLVKRFLFLILLSVVSQFAIAQSVPDDGAVLTAPRTYKKVSGDTVRLRASKAAEVEELADKVFAKVMQANGRARRNAARELARRYKLGDRIILRGDSGRDVRSVANALVKKLYIKPEDVMPTFDGGALLDGALFDALLRFQKDKRLPIDGKVSKDVVKELRRK